MSNKTTVITRQQLEDSVARILLWKDRLGLLVKVQ